MWRLVFGEFFLWKCVLVLSYSEWQDIQGERFFGTEMKR